MIALAEKIGMTQVFDLEGMAQAVTVLKVSGNRVVGLKTKEKHGYEAMQLGYGLNTKDKRKAMVKIYGEKKVPRLIREFNNAKLGKAVGDEIVAGDFEGIKFLDVQAKSIGRGFQGVVKRHGFAGGPKTHGSHFHRVPGSIGNCSYPAKVFKGKKLPGRMGGVNVTVQNLKLVQVDKENGLILVKGAVPGKRGGVVVIKKAVKK